VRNQAEFLEQVDQAKPCPAPLAFRLSIAPVQVYAHVPVLQVPIDFDNLAILLSIQIRHDLG